MAEDVSRDQVMARRFQLDEQITILQGKHKAEIEPLQQEMSLCEQYIKKTMIEGNEQQIKTADGHMTYFTTQDSVKVGDWNQTLPYIIQNQAWHLLNQAVNKTACKEFMEANKTAPPGVSYESRRVLAWRRGRA